MKITLQQLKRGATLSFADCFTMEYRMTQQCMVSASQGPLSLNLMLAHLIADTLTLFYNIFPQRDKDFYEGIRAGMCLKVHSSPL